MCVPGGGVCAWLTRQQRARALRWYPAECRAPTESILFAQGSWATTSSVPRSCGSVMVRGCGSVLLQWLSRLHGKAFALLHPPRALITRYPADRAALWQGGEEQ